jgi:hypothetical protein
MRWKPLDSGAGSAWSVKYVVTLTKACDLGSRTMHQCFRIQFVIRSDIFFTEPLAFVSSVRVADMLTAPALIANASNHAHVHAFLMTFLMVDCICSSRISIHPCAA